MHVTVRSAHAAVLLLTLAAFGAMATVLPGHPGFPLDDSYIHQTVARNFIQTGVPGLIAGQRSSGSTSAIWTYVQAVQYAVGGKHPVACNLVLSAALLLMIAELLWRVALREQMPLRVAAIWAGAPALCGNFLWLGLIGMEHLLFCAFSIAAIFFWAEAKEQSRSASAAAAGVFAGLVALTRPEGVVLIAVLALSAGWVGRARKDAAIAVAAWLPLFVLLLANNYYTSHALLPATFAGRSWLYFRQYGGPHSVGAITNLLGSWLARPAKMLLPASVLLVPTLWRKLEDAACMIVLLLLLGTGVVKLFRSRARAMQLLCLWCGVHMLAFLALFPNSGHGGRYQPLYLMLVFPLVLMGIEKISRRRSTLFFAAAMLGAVSILSWRAVTQAGIMHIARTHGEVAQWINQNVPPGVPVASFDIGRISYDRTSGPVIDLGGLADPGYVAYLKSGRTAQYLAARNVKYVVVPEGMLADLALQQAVGAPLAQFCSPRQLWLIGYAATHHAARCQTIYALGAESLASTASSMVN